MYSPNIKAERKMKLDDFIKNLRGGVQISLSNFTHVSIVHRYYKKGLSSLSTYPPAEKYPSFDTRLPLVLLLLSISVPFCASCKLLLRTLPLRLSLRGSGS